MMKAREGSGSGHSTVSLSLLEVSQRSKAEFRPPKVGKVSSAHKQIRGHSGERSPLRKRSVRWLTEGPIHTTDTTRNKFRNRLPRRTTQLPSFIPGWRPSCVFRTARSAASRLNPTMVIRSNRRPRTAPVLARLRCCWPTQAQPIPGGSSGPSLLEPRRLSRPRKNSSCRC